MHSPHDSVSPFTRSYAQYTPIREYYVVGPQRAAAFSMPMWVIHLCPTFGCWVLFTVPKEMRSSKQKPAKCEAEKEASHPSDRGEGGTDCQ